MKRREFVITLTAGAIGASPLVAMATQNNPFWVDSNGNIHYIGEGEHYTVKELYDFMKNEAEVSAHSDELIEFGHGWRITGDAAEKLKDGAIVQNDIHGRKETWQTFTTIGDFVGEMDFIQEFKL
jgi:hypothetical protein